MKPQPAERPTTALGVEKVDGRLRLGPTTALVVEQIKGRLRLVERPIEAQPQNQLASADAAKSSVGNARPVAAGDFRFGGKTAKISEGQAWGVDGRDWHLSSVC